MPALHVWKTSCPKRPIRDPLVLTTFLDRTLNRPRDVIAFLNNASRLAVGKNRLVWDALYGAEQAYSEGRLRALFDEWHENYDGLDIVSDKMLMGRKPRFPMSDWNDGALVDLFTDSQTDGRSWLKSHAQEFDSMYQSDEERSGPSFCESVRSSDVRSRSDRHKELLKRVRHLRKRPPSCLDTRRHQPPIRGTHSPNVSRCPSDRYSLSQLR